MPPARPSGSPARTLVAMKQIADKTNRIQPHSWKRSWWCSVIGKSGKFGIRIIIPDLFYGKSIFFELNSFDFLMYRSMFRIPSIGECRVTIVGPGASIPASTPPAARGNRADR